MSREADIARFKYYRNTVYGHTECASVDDATFTEHMLKRHQVRLGEKYKSVGRNTNQPLTILILSTWTLKLKNTAKNFSASGRKINAT